MNVVRDYIRKNAIAVNGMKLYFASLALLCVFAVKKNYRKGRSTVRRHLDIAAKRRDTVLSI